MYNIVVLYFTAVCHDNIMYSIKGHIQIGQIPDRNEPSADGKINFTSFFKMLEDVGYDGWVTGEYYASGW